MIRLEDRQLLAKHIDTAHSAGARLEVACEVAGINARTLERWRVNGGLTVGDRRPDTPHPTPAHALTEEERAEILAVANSPRFADQPPARIVPTLADEGVYLASESSFHRVLRSQGQTAHRGRARQPQVAPRKPTTHVATAPGQVWCWDVTYLPTGVEGQWFYLYLILDLYSRMVIGWEVHDKDDSDHAAALVQRTALAEGVHAMTEKPVLHGDNGSTVKRGTVITTLQWLGIQASHSRPRVSDDNAFAESLFKTAKYRPEFPSRGFVNLEAARTWAHSFVNWYNFEHRHSGIRYVTPAQRHSGEDVALLAARHQTYLQARERKPARWSGSTRDWSHKRSVALNPERKEQNTVVNNHPKKDENGETGG